MLHISGKIHPIWRITKYIDAQARAAGLPYESNEIRGNLLLNEGITELLKLLVGAAADAFNAANAFIGVGDSNTAAAASQTGLQAATNKLYVAVTGAPVVSGQAVTWEAEFAGGEANFAWQEFTVANGNSDSADNLNRLVSDQGTKTAGQVWTVALELTIS